MNNQELMERFRQEVNSDPKIHCTNCGQIAIPITVKDDEAARMCMCGGYTFEDPPLDRDRHELPDGWEWA